MKHINIMLKPASGVCNMRCAYCFYADILSHREISNYGRMSLTTAHQIVDHVYDDLTKGDQVTFTFQGGEPTLAGLDFFRDFFSYASENNRGIRVDFALQTNGFLIDKSWCELLKKHPVLVGLSIDGYKQLHDSYRRDTKNGETFGRIMRAKELFDSYKLDYNVLTVLTNQTARHPQKIWNFILKEKIEYIQFIPCLDELDSQKRSAYALTPERFYKFYSALFPLWVRRLQQGEYISIKFLDDLVNYYLKGLPTACGMNGRCNVQCVCEGDGSMFPCDFYMLDQYRMGSLAEENLNVLRKKGCSFPADGRAYAGQPPCSNCKYYSTCRGGCKRMKESMYIDGGFCWYEKLLDEILQPLLRIGHYYAGAH